MHKGATVLKEINDFIVNYISQNK